MGLPGPTYKKEQRAVRSALRHVALAAGETVYNPPFPCRYGHLGPWQARANTCVACNAAANAKWHAGARDRNNEKKREAHRARAAIERPMQAVWKAANREKVNVYERNRRALKKASSGRHTADDIAEIRKLQRNMCAYCRASVNGRRGHVDHVLPLALGGGNGRENLQMLCKPCNSSKSSLHPIEFAQRLGRLI